MLSFLKRVPLDAMSAAGRGQISGARQSPSKIPRENLVDKEVRPEGLSIVTGPSGWGGSGGPGPTAAAECGGGGCVGGG